MAIPLLDGWNITRNADTDWVPWGDGGARAKVLGSADGYLVALVEADAGYQGTPHVHGFAEFFTWSAAGSGTKARNSQAATGTPPPPGHPTMTSRCSNRRPT